MLIPSKLKFTPGFFLGNCPCCGGGATPGTTDCGDCVGGNQIGDTWRVTISGVSDGTNTDCTVFNGTHDMPVFNNSGSSCSFKLTGLGAEGQNIGLNLSTDSTPQITSANVFCRMDPFDTLVAAWAVTANHACTSTSITAIPSTFTSGDCSGWQATVTVTKV